MVMPRAWDRLERFMRWEHKKKYGRLPSGEELKRVKGELYVSEMIRRDMKKALEMFFEEFLRIGL